MAQEDTFSEEDIQMLKSSFLMGGAEEGLNTPSYEYENEDSNSLLNLSSYKPVVNKYGII